MNYLLSVCEGGTLAANSDGVGDRIAGLEVGLCMQLYPHHHPFRTISGVGDAITGLDAFRNGIGKNGHLSQWPGAPR